MKPVQVAIDTNVLVAALKSRHGASFRLLSLLPDGHFLPNISVPLFIEYESVLKRPGLLDHLKASEIDDILDYVLSRSSIREIYYLWRRS